MSCLESLVVIVLKQGAEVVRDHRFVQRLLVLHSLDHLGYSHWRYHLVVLERADFVIFFFVLVFDEGNVDGGDKRFLVEGAVNATIIGYVQIVKICLKFSLFILEQIVEVVGNHICQGIGTLLAHHTFHHANVRVSHLRWHAVLLAEQVDFLLQLGQ